MVYSFNLPIAGSKAHNGFEISLKSCLKLAELRKNRPRFFFFFFFFWGESFHILEGGLRRAVWSSLEAEAMKRLWTPPSRPCNMWFRIRTIVNCKIRGSPTQFWFFLWWPRHGILKFQTSNSLFKHGFWLSCLWVLWNCLACMGSSAPGSATVNLRKDAFLTQVDALGAFTSTCLVY